MAKKPNWQNRIISSGEEDADQLLANPFNARIHPQFQQQALEGVLDTIGWVQRVIVNQRTGHVVDGHLRVALAITRGEQVPVDYVDLTEDEEKAILASFDYITSLAVYDKDQLDTLLKQVNSDDARVQELLSKLAEDVGLYKEPPAAPDAQIDRAAELQQKWQVERGQLWEIGKHRLLCGDSTNADDVARVMGGEKAVLVVTSPPYFNQRPEYATFETYEKYNLFLSEIITRIIEIADRPFILAWNTGDNQPDCLPMIADQTVLIHGMDFTYLDTIIWKKAGAVYSIPRSAHIRTHQYYYPALAWEPIIIFRLGDKMPNFDTVDVNTVSNFGINVWEINQVIGSEQDKVGHPAMFPVELASRVMLAYSRKSNVVFEPFSGAGTTIVAAEQTKRIARGIELEPKYCAVILERMSAMQLEPRLVE